ncbi:MAG: mechanosensitive ion channel protein MscS [Candidatus Omnitrophica bacterium CG11_big_fil_rev_8_21_14_0_20_45_26]|uniref:Mechanosensitive ion channel protein MscS n=1 Tax=Candidatus Abzuiibacterium crystallinum TaxID=1974748 RepID=A0A2H0LSK0_9BACT|nr:MAG: mechanosensitive ion channel protein MscS [Candidatus Omnitrophica bacterium CG11_big_fil_rev_8_21_14_0_20_45_26]PIW63490.1 MAG: mechanosensitive ion channel protein MscS [Candidatus Omnitrophica bacterium CG12_big_fil_rev_8_21_14_0_65_45_16]
MPTFEQIRQWLNIQLFNNTLRDYSVALVTLVGLILIFALVKKLTVVRLRRFAKKTVSDLDDFIAELVNKIGFPSFVVISLYIATQPLHLEKTLESIIKYLFVVVITFRAVTLLQQIAAYGVAKSYQKARPDDPAAQTVVKNLTAALRWAIWALGLVFVLDNLGINISALVAGLGIGGIAVAMASQAILGDAFSALSIFVDKPFQVGDFIIVGDFMGTVEYIGLKTTRVRSLGGEQLIFSNTDLTSSRIKNYKRMYERRVLFNIGVIYQTSSEQVKKIPFLVQEVINKIEGIRLDRVHFASFGDFSLNYEIVYYVLSPDYNVYMDKQQAINFALKDVFEKEGIEFAYPTQTLFVTKDS